MMALVFALSEMTQLVMPPQKVQHLFNASKLSHRAGRVSTNEAKEKLFQEFGWTTKYSSI